MASMTRALIVVDVQNDFCEGGSLPVDGGARVAYDIGQLLRERAASKEPEPTYGLVVATKDHHIDPGDHFGNPPDYVDSWPAHCVVGTDGEAFHPNLDPVSFDEIFRKGEYAAAYSGFEGAAKGGATLVDWLRERGVEEVDVCGLATDYCVRATVLDARAAGFGTTLLSDLTAGVAAERTAAAIEEMRAAGVTVL
ncbi:nicotinamidase [Nocardioides albus]|uniref:nicotinamidase n=1 Tax=Nocardioides albus TaxID=1841 RepID=UPI0023DDDDDA|nr:nicotinamidase [Nocardioides albus]